MKIIRFLSAGSSQPEFGVVIENYAIAFSVLQEKAATQFMFLSDSHGYLENLPDSDLTARFLVEWGESHLQELSDSEKCHLKNVQLLAPVEATALFDFGLTPLHLKNSFVTLMSYEKDDPDIGGILQAVGSWLTEENSEPETEATPLPYYKCNMNSIVGDDTSIPWPLYTAHLDIEPELAVVYGNPNQPVAGFTIFNDISARDVQAPEFIGGLCLTKDMAAGNQLGPYLVTPDEITEPYNQKVTVRVNDVERYVGSTSEISHKVEVVFSWLGSVCPLKSGTIVGMGTIPGCTGLDFDDFLEPGDEIEICFEHLGKLNCKFAEPERKLHPSRWPLRAAIKKYA